MENKSYITPNTIIDLITASMVQFISHHKESNLINKIRNELLEIAKNSYGIAQTNEEDGSNYYMVLNNPHISDFDEWRWESCAIRYEGQGFVGIYNVACDFNDNVYDTDLPEDCYDWDKKLADIELIDKYDTTDIDDRSTLLDAIHKYKD